MLEIAQAAVQEALRNGAGYADARVCRLRREELSVRNGEVDNAEAPEELGIGVRVLVNGSLGFLAAPLFADLKVAEQNARALGRRAPRMAEALEGAQRQKTVLAPQAPQTGEYATPCAIDPFGVPLADKLALLRAAEESMRGGAELAAREASLSLRRKEQWYASSEGSALYQNLVRTGAGIAAHAAAGGRSERRSYPASFGGDFRAAGFEHALGLKLAEHGARMRDEAFALTRAPDCPSGTRDLILAGNQLMLQIHESIGHPAELDRALGEERDLAGSSFLKPTDVGRLPLGSAHAHLVADHLEPGGLDTRGWDDEGVPSGRWPIVEHGVLRGMFTGRESAARAGESQSRGCSRAESWYHPPIVRIPNVSLLPGEWTLERLIADTQDGILCEGVRTWSIDQRRLDFQFTTEIGWEIKDGKLGRMLRAPTYQGRTPEFWAACDAVCDAAHWQLWGVPNCGKGNPMQVAEMSHGCAPARFRNVRFL